MLNYLIEMLVCQALFLGLYQVFKSEPYFRVNRFYLLLTLIFSLVLPLLSFGQVIPYSISQTYIEWLQPLQIGGQTTTESVAPVFSNLQESSSMPWHVYHLIYAVGLIFYFVWFIFRNRTIFHYLNLNSFDAYKLKSLVFIPKSKMAFSFWDRIYLGADIPENQRQVILEHEYQHLMQKHSWDVMLVEMLQWLMWFNPLIYFYKIQLRQIHEFEADQHVTTSLSKATYINTLLNQNFGCQNVSFINTFFHSSNLKNRITMLQQTHSSNLKKLKYLLILPIMILAVLLSCTEDEILESQLTEKDINEEVSDYMKKFVEQEPSIFEMMEKKPSLEIIFSTYGLEIKDNYSEIEERKVGVVLSFIMVLPKQDGAYKEELLKEINNSKGLIQAYNKVENIIENSISYKADTHSGELDLDHSVPFTLIDKPPHPAECSELSGDELKKCVSQFISKHVNQNFNISKFNHLDAGNYRISVQFTINSSGVVSQTKASGATRELEEEAIQAILSLPSLIPGKVDGESVNVLYGLPINFVINK